MIKRRNLIAAASVIVLSGAVTTGSSALAAQPDIYSKASIAINGYDPVAYFTGNKPVKGDAGHSANWNGALWHFASQGNKDKFGAAPKKYAPQYGGYCAFAVSYGSTATTVPEAWTIVGGKLYLNHSLGVRTKWRTDTVGYIVRADKNWPGVLQ